MSDRTASAGSIKKAAVVLDLLSQHDELTIADIAKRSDQPRSSVYRLISSMTDVGFVEPGTERGRVRLGSSVFELARAAGRRYDIRRVSGPVLRRLREEVGVSVYLCVREGYQARCVAYVAGEGADMLTMRTGTAMPLHLGAAAKLLLAYAGPEFWERYLAHVDFGDEGLPKDMKGDLARRMTPQLQDLEREMEEIRVASLSVSDNDVVLGVASLGVPVRDSTGAVVAAISIGGPASWVMGDHHRANTNALRRASYELSIVLGYDGGPAHVSPGVPRLPDMGGVVDVALVVGDVEAALSKHAVIAPRRDRTVLELGPEHVASNRYRGREVSSTIRFSPAPSPHSMTLVAPVSGPSVHRDWLERHGEGLHQVTVAVASVDRALEPITRRGTAVLEITRGATVGPFDEWACLDTAAELGYLLRLARPRPGTGG